MRLSNRLFALCLPLLLAACQSEQNSDSQAAPAAENTPIPSLQAQLDAKHEAFTANASQDLIDDFEQGVRDVAESGVMASALQVGDTVPMFTLPDAHGESVSLETLLAGGPVVIAWYRGGWCPYCNLELKALQDALPQLTAAGGQLVAISPELPDSSLSTAERDSLRFTVLSDHGNAVAEQFGIVYTLPRKIQDRFAGRLDIPAYNGDSSQTLPLAVSYVVAQDGTIAYAFVDPDYRKRAEPAAIIAALKELGAKK